jgi:hypothetical protein
LYEGNAELGDMEYLKKSSWIDLPTPRKVRYRTDLKTLSLSLLAVALITSMNAFFFSVSGAGRSWLYGEGTMASIMRLDVVDTGRGGMHYEATVNFLDSHGSRAIIGLPLSKAAYRTLAPGDTVPIHYLQNEDRGSYDKDLPPEGTTIFVTLFVLANVFITFGAIRFVIRSYRLLKLGIGCSGNVTENANARFRHAFKASYSIAGKTFSAKLRMKTPSRRLDRVELLAMPTGAYAMPADTYFPWEAVDG